MAVCWPEIVFVSINFFCILILGLLSARFLPRYHQSVITTLRDKPWASLGIGFIAAVVVPVLFATVLAIPLVLILMTAFFILLYWSRIYAIGMVVEFDPRSFAAGGAVEPRLSSWDCSSTISSPSFL